MNLPFAHGRGSWAHTCWVVLLAQGRRARQAGLSGGGQMPLLCLLWSVGLSPGLCPGSPSQGIFVPPAPALVWVHSFSCPRLFFRTARFLPWRNPLPPTPLPTNSPWPLLRMLHSTLPSCSSAAPLSPFPGGPLIPTLPGMAFRPLPSPGELPSPTQKTVLPSTRARLTHEASIPHPPGSPQPAGGRPHLGCALRARQVNHEQPAQPHLLQDVPDAAALTHGHLEHGVGARGRLVGCRGLLGPLPVPLHQQLHYLRGCAAWRKPLLGSSGEAPTDWEGAQDRVGPLLCMVGPREGSVCVSSGMAASVPQGQRGQGHGRRCESPACCHSEFSMSAPAQQSGQLLPGSSPLSPPVPPVVSVPLHCPCWLHKTRLFGIDGGDLGDSSHLDHPFGVLSQLQVPQGGVQQVPDHLIIDLMGQVGDRCKWETEGRWFRQGSCCPSLLSEMGQESTGPFLARGWGVEGSASTGKHQAARAKDTKHQNQGGLPLWAGWALGRGWGPD